MFAVVGLGHAKGIQETLRRWSAGESDPEADCRELTVVPPTPWTARRMLGLLAVIALLLLLLLIFILRFMWRSIF